MKTDWTAILLICQMFASGGENTGGWVFYFPHVFCMGKKFKWKDTDLPFFVASFSTVDVQALALRGRSSHPPSQTWL